MAEETKNSNSGEQSGPVIERAKEMGWCPKDEWRGNPEHWIDADAFVERGETLMPLLKANNRRQAQEINSLRTQLAENHRLLQANTETIEELKRFNSTSLREQARQQKKDLTAAIVEARKEGNVEEEIELTGKLSETTKVLSEAEEAARNPSPKSKGNGRGSSPSASPPDEQPLHPDFQDWASDNKWFGQDPVKTNLALGVSEKLRQDPKYKGVEGRAFLDAVTAEVDTILEGSGQRRSKVESGSNGNGSGGGGGSRGGKTYASLPSDAKAACDKQASRLVGEGRAFKTVDQWRAHYVAKYYEE